MSEDYRNGPSRRAVLIGAAGGAASIAGTMGLGSRLAFAFPDQPVNVVVPYAPGATDQLARAFATEMEKTLGKPVVVETRPGAGGTIGAAYVARNARADGHTLLFSVSSPLTIAPHQNRLPYAVDDLRPVARVALSPNVMAARADAPFKDLASLIAYAKANPEKVTYGSAGTGGSTHLAGEAFAAAAGVRLTHIPFQGVVPAVTAAVGGTVDLAIGFAQHVMPQIKGGRLFAVAQFGAKRAAVIPDIPTFREGGVDMSLSALIGIWAPKATPDEVVQQLAASVEKATTGQAVVDFATQTLTEIDYANPTDFAADLKEESDFMLGLLRKLGMAK